jgi:hypothetical protein
MSLTGRDVVGQAQTGIGITTASLATVFTRLLALSERKPGLPAEDMTGAVDGASFDLASTEVFSRSPRHLKP